MVVSGCADSPASVLIMLLTKIVAHLGNDLVGHAKAVAHVEGGVFHASTTGTDAGVDVKTVGNPSPTSASFRLDFMCVFHGQRYRRLLQAWDSAVAALVVAGLSLTQVENVSPPSPAVRRVILPITGALASSFLVLKPCCLIPLVWSVSGGGIAFLQVFEPLEPYRPAFIALTLALLMAAFHRLYFGEGTVSNENIRTSIRRCRRALWFATAVFVASTFYPILAPHQPDAMHHGASHIHQ